LRGAKSGTFMVGPGRHLASLRHWFRYCINFIYWFSTSKLSASCSNRYWM